MKRYTGVGSRKTPVSIQKMFNKLGFILEKQNWILRSGGAIGSDTAFDKFVQNKVMTEIYLTKDNFKIPHGITQYPKFNEAQQIMIENNIHPYFNTMKASHKALHTRNVFQVLGANLDAPSQMLVCWTPNGEKTLDECVVGVTGGTMTAIKLACLYDVPVFNAANENDYQRLQKFIAEHQHLIPDNLMKRKGLYNKMH